MNTYTRYTNIIGSGELARTCESNESARTFNTVICIAGVVVDMYGLHGYQMGSRCQVGLRRLLRRADYISAPCGWEQGAKWDQIRVGSGPGGSKGKDGAKVRADLTAHSTYVQLYGWWGTAVLQ